MGQEIVQGKYYLKKCIVILRSAERLAPLMPLCERLVKTGISCQVMLSEELLSFGASSEEVLNSRDVVFPSGYTDETWLMAVVEETLHMRGRQLECAKDSDAEKLRSVLYLTDDPMIYTVMAAAFQVISVCHPPVLIYLHSGNQGADFGDACYALEEPEEVEPEYLERVYRRCYNLPWEILVTEHCWLRETVEEDVDSFWKMYQDSELTRYTERLYPTLEAERNYVRDYRKLVYSFYEFGVWTVLDRQSGMVVGRAGLSVREGYDLPELGFVIGREWQGRGLAGEVCQGILQYARESLGFDRIQVLVHEENAVSLHLCHKLGFQEQVAPRAAVNSYEKQPSISGIVSQPCHTEKEQDKEFVLRGRKKGNKVCPSCVVEMEQNGQQARFIYMIYDGGG